MSYDNRDNIDFGGERISKLFKIIFLPTLLGMLADVAFILTDGIFVGHGIGPEGLAGINIVGPTMMLITGLGVMFGMGASIVGAIHLAKNNEKAARINVTQAFIASSAISLIFVALFCSYPIEILQLLGASDHLADFAKEYFIWFIPTCFFIMIQIVGSFAIRLDGSPKYSMMATLIPSVLNIILDYTFIFPLKMGLMGAALATDIGTFVGAAMTVYYMFARANTLKLYRLKWTATGWRLGFRNVRHMMRIGLSGFVGEFAVSMIMLMGNLSFGQYLGDNGIAAFSVICYMFPILINIFIAVSSSAQPILSFNFGAGFDDRVRKTMHFGMMISVMFAASVTLVFWTAGPQIISIFLDPATAGENSPFTLAANGLPLIAIGFVPMGINLISIGYLQSIERSLASIVLTLLRGYILIVPAFLILPKIVGIPGLWLAMPVSEFLTALASYFCIRRHQTTRKTC